jgi:hypothetical protein
MMRVKMGCFGGDLCGASVEKTPGRLFEWRVQDDRPPERVALHRVLPDGAKTRLEGWRRPSTSLS